MNSEIPEVFEPFSDMLAIAVIGGIIHLVVIIFALLHLRNLDVSDILKFYWCVFMVLGPLFGVVAYAILMSDVNKLGRKMNRTFEDWNRRPEVETTENQFWECPKCTSTNSNRTFVCHGCGYSLK